MRLLRFTEGVERPHFQPKAGLDAIHQRAQVSRHLLIRLGVEPAVLSVVMRIKASGAHLRQAGVAEAAIRQIAGHVHENAVHRIFFQHLRAVRQEEFVNQLAAVGAEPGPEELGAVLQKLAVHRAAVRMHRRPLGVQPRLHFIHVLAEVGQQLHRSLRAFYGDFAKEVEGQSGVPPARRGVEVRVPVVAQREDGDAVHPRRFQRIEELDGVELLADGNEIWRMKVQVNLAQIVVPFGKGRHDGSVSDCGLAIL
ncbi:MAG: hypothetical protein BWY76_02791 [bacterium ADurb.Bin429]|nr:MAG: hypothetical protein BWY76_02791 [bacterium ADurb.Bin429]